MPSESSETAARSAKCFPNPRKQLRAPRNAFPSSRKPPCALRSPSRILGNLHALREMLSKALETFARSAKCLPSPRKRLRAPRNAFRILGNFCALREMPSGSSETAARSAKCLQRRLKPPRAPQNAFRALGNLRALRDYLSQTTRYLPD